MKKITVGLVEPVKIIADRKKIQILAKFDTGAERTSIDKNIVSELGIKPVGKTTTFNVHGKTIRPIVNINLEIKGKEFKVKANVSDRSSIGHKILIGRDVIFSNFIVDITKSHKSHRLEDLK
jgi:hypothetical protein